MIKQYIGKSVILKVRPSTYNPPKIIRYICECGREFATLDGHRVHKQRKGVVGHKLGKIDIR